MAVWYQRLHAGNEDLEALLVETSLKIITMYLVLFSMQILEGPKVDRTADLSRITSRSTREVIHRAMELSRRSDFSLKIRLTHLSLVDVFATFVDLHDQSHDSDGDSARVLNDCCDLPLITTASSLLSDMGSTVWLGLKAPKASFHEYFCDDVMELWSQMLAHASAHRIRHIAVECANSDMLQHLAVWTANRGSDVTDDFRPGMLPNTYSLLAQDASADPPTSLKSNGRGQSLVCSSF